MVGKCRGSILRYRLTSAKKYGILVTGGDKNVIRVKR